MMNNTEQAQTYGWTPPPRLIRVIPSTMNSLRIVPFIERTRNTEEGGKLQLLVQEGYSSCNYLCRRGIVGVSIG